MDGQTSRIEAEPEEAGKGGPDVEHFDVLLVGAGLSGIGAAWHLQQRCPDRTWLILEGREAIGGTWDLFRYPGIRSDSDMFTLGFAFKPWLEAKAIADGPSILSYVCQTAEENGIDRHIRFRHLVTKADWSSREARWTVEAGRPTPARRCASPATGCTCAAAITIMRKAICPISWAWTVSRVSSSILNSGRTTWTIAASASW